MKKNKVTISLLSTFVGVFGLASCSGITAAKDSIMVIKDYNGNSVNISADELYNKHNGTSSGISSYYDAVLETLIRFQYQNPGFAGYTQLAKDYNTIKSLAQNEVTAQKKKAETNASTNGTKYADEWEAILEGKGVEDENGLLEYFIYEHEKDEMETWYYERNKETLLKEYIGLNNSYEQVANELVNAMYPYHMKHILVKTSGTASEHTRDSITESEAKNLANAMELFTEVDGAGNRKNNFNAIAYTSINEDTSKDSYGDLGIVTTETSFVNEFKLGIYAYDAVLSGINSETTSNNTIYNGLGLNNTIKHSGATATVKEKLTNLNVSAYQGLLSEVPVQVFERIGALKDKVKNDAGEEVNEGNSAFFPRNILWNNYLNIHHPFVITYDTIAGETEALKANDGCFKQFPGYFNDKKVLTDEVGRVIVGVRSEYGIHFMVIEKSIFKATNEMTIGGTGDGKYSLGLEDYYTSTVPEDKNGKITYITALNRNDETSKYRERANTIKDAVKSFDKTYDYRLFEEIKKGLTIEYKTKEMASNIENYINQLRFSNKVNSKDSLTSSWQTYIELLEQEDVARKDEYSCVAGEYKGTRLSNVCYQKFGAAKTGEDEFKKGGACYYGK